MRKTLTLILTSVLLAACGGTQTATSNRSTATPIRVEVTAAGATLSCRLPVAGFVPPGPKGAPWGYRQMQVNAPTQKSP